jgi:hypothetical protein
MTFKSFSLKWWWYGLVEDLHDSCKKELQELENEERKKGHDWVTPKEQLPHGWISVGKPSLDNIGKPFTIFGPYRCMWESPDHRAIRRRYTGKIFQRRIAHFSALIPVIGGLLGVASFIMQCLSQKG